jgi:hypothetical protein
MSVLNIGTAILSVSTPGTAFLPSSADAVALARDINDYLADLVKVQPDRFGFFATIPLPHIAESVDEVVRSLDELTRRRRRAARQQRRGVPRPGRTSPGVDGIPPFAVDFLLDTTRAAYLLVRNGICRRYLPSLLAFAKPGHVTFGSDWPFAPVAAGKLFTAGCRLGGRSGASRGKQGRHARCRATSQHPVTVS